AESDHVIEHARAKLERKGVDLLIVNDVSAPGAGFEHETNEVVILDRDGAVQRVSLRSKEAVSLEILTRVASLLSQGAT
ncbi:MAG: phosphopantothenoylcysteine decarboxylase, partial [Acidimicrobiales bacterium]